MSPPLHVAFVFASRGIGGAERSMLRLMASAHPSPFTCHVIVPARENRLLRDAVRAVGVPYHSLPPGSSHRLLRLLRELRPDVLYVFGRFRTIPWAVLGRLAGIRCVVAAERSAANRWSDLLARRLDRRLVTAYLANSEFAAVNLRRIVGKAPPVFVVPNGIASAAPVRRHDRWTGTPSLLCVGNITPNKGQGVLLEAIRLLRERHPGLRATLVGRDFTGGRFFQTAAERGLRDTYTAVGFVDDVSTFLARADILVLPTLHREGMPTSLLEAMRAGVPVVATRVGGVSEIVEDGTTGLLVTPGDARGLALAIGSLLDDEPRRHRLAGAARARALERYDVGAMVEGHRGAFASALARASGPRVRSDSAPGVARPVASVAHVTTVPTSLRYLLLSQLASLRDHGFDVTAISSPGEDAAAVEARGIPHVAVPMTRRITPLADARSLARLYRAMRRHRFTIVHAHTPKPGLLAQVAARLAGVPVVVNTIHGFYFHDGMRKATRRFYVALERLAARCSDVILSQNVEDVETALREGIARPGQIRHLGNGIDLDRFDPDRVGPEVRRATRASLGIEENAPVVGFVGRLVAEKGVPELLAAARLVRARYPDARFLLVGAADAEKTDRISPELLREHGDGVVLAGQRQDMPEVYGAMDVFALPSHREGFPRAPMEASAMRVPCVVTDVRGCRQTVRHRESGLVVRSGDPRALAEALLALLDARDLARSLGEAGRRRALVEFDEQRVFAVVRAEYRRLLESKGLLPRKASATDAREHRGGEPREWAHALKG